jgi:hypothetical protein
MATIKKFEKDPEEVLDFQFDFKPLTNGVSGAKSDYLETGETITSQTVTADTGLTVDSSSESGGAVTVFLSGGTAGRSYRVVCKIVTSGLRTARRSFLVEVKRR